jgi:acyl-CoA dehydrogenase
MPPRAACSTTWRECVPQSNRYGREAGIVDREAWEKAGAAGLLCAAVPEEYGGAGGTFAHEHIIMYQLGLAGLDSFGIALHNAIVAPYILHYGTEEQKRRWLPKLASGEMIGAIAMTEPGAGSDLQGVRTSAARDGNQYRVNGQKTFITNGQHANLIIVVAKTDPAAGAKGTSLIVIETDEVEGFRRGRNLDKIGLKGNDTSELFFDDVMRADGESARRRRGQGLRPAHGAAPPGASPDRRPGHGHDRARARAHHRLRQGAQGLRQGDHRVPEHPVQARRMQDRGDCRPRCSTTTAPAS